MTTYFASNYRDSFKGFHVALKRAGYKRVYEQARADFLFFDAEPRHNNSKRTAFDAMVKQKPTFLYPHTPYAFWLWDGYLKPNLDICANFVVGNAAVQSMRIYGYPCRVEPVGLSRCGIRPFVPTEGKHLVYAPARLIGSEGTWPHPGDEILHRRAFQWVVRNRRAFNGVTAYYTYSLEKCGMDEYRGIDGIEFVDAGDAWRLNTQTARHQLQIADIVISCNTFGYIALARGIPTVLFGHNAEVPMHSSNYGVHYADYAKWCAFPFKLENMSASWVLALTHGESEAVAAWKSDNIGSGFDADRFISVVREFI